jgi:RimK family alpha-L-glutamate ligase
MRILIIGQPDRTENRRLVEEGRAAGHKITNVALTELVFEMDQGFRVLVEGQDVREAFDAIYIRGIFPQVSEALLLAELAHNNGIRVMDLTLATENYIQSKTYQTWRLGRAGISMPHGFQTADWEDLRLRTAGMQWPLVLKGVHGSQGQHVHLCANESEAKKLFDTHEPGFFIVQPFLKIKDEYRVLTLGGRALGAIRKTAPTDDFRANISLGGNAEAAELPAEQIALCERAIDELGFEFAGVDLAITTDGQPLILEVNRSPGFSGFEEATGQNVAATVIEYLSN